MILYFIRPYKSSAASSVAQSLTKNASGTTDLVINDEEKVVSQSSSSEIAASIPNRTAKLILTGLCLAIYAAAEFGHFSFSTSMFQYLEIGLSASQSAMVTSILSATFTLGRLLTAFISIRLQPDLIISYHYAIIIISLGVLYIGRHNLVVIYLSTAGLGYGYSCVWPAFFSFTERHLKLTDRVSSCYSFLFGVTS